MSGVHAFFLKSTLDVGWFSVKEHKKVQHGEGKVDHKDSITDHITVGHISVLHCWYLTNIIFQECRFCSG